MSGTKKAKSTALNPKELVEKDSRRIFNEVYRLTNDGEYKKALKQLLSDDEQVKSIFDEDLNHAWYCVGDLFYLDGQYEKALGAFRRSLQDWPGDLDALMGLGNTYSELKLFEKAMQCFAMICEVDPTNDSAKYNLACAFMDQGRYVEAKQNFESMTSLGKSARLNLELCDAKINLIYQ